MGKFDGVLLATDFDDTYLGEDLKVHPDNLQALAYFKAQGGLFTVATGRAYRTFTPYRHLAPTNVPVILSNGSQLYDYEKNQMILERVLPGTAPSDLEMLSRLIPDLSLEAYHGEDIYIWNPNIWTLAHLVKVGCDGEECAIRQMPQGWGKAILLQEHDILEKAQSIILERWSDRYEAIFSNPNMLELTAKGSTKGGMVLELAKRLGVERQNIYCVGDNQNDIPMLAVSAVPFAPANCAQSVKDWGAVLLPDCRDGAIGRLIEILDTRY